jgi:hypothetical protein
VTYEPPSWCFFCLDWRSQHPLNISICAIKGYYSLKSKSGSSIVLMMLLNASSKRSTLCALRISFETIDSVVLEQYSTLEELSTLIKEVFQQTVDEKLSTDEKNCNNFFQFVENVDARFDLTFNGINLNETNTEGRRLLREATSQRVLQESPSSAPTTGSAAEELQESPSSAPTTAFGAENFGYVLLFVSGVCNGCVNDFFLGNQVTNRRQVQTAVDPFRWLQNAGSSASHCYCPTEAIVSEADLSSDSLLEGFNSGFTEIGVPLVVNDAEELKCERNDFKSQLTFQFAALAIANLDDINDFGEFMADLYNDMVERYCDPLYPGSN